MSDIVDLISQFRMTLYEYFPYISPYVYSLTPVEKPGLGTMAVDKYGRMYYDPEWSKTLTLEQGGYVVVHEAVHLILRHCHRAPGIIGDNPTPLERHIYNVAVDCVVWEFMEAVKDLAPPGGVTLPELQKLYPDIKPGMTAEELYWIMTQTKEPEDEQEDTEPGDDGEGEDTDGPGDEGDSSEGDIPGNPGSESDDAGSEHDPDGPGDQDGNDPGTDGPHPTNKFKVTQSSASDGIPNDFEDEPDPKWEAFQEANLLEACEKKIEELEEDGEWLRTRGTIPAGLKRHIKSLLRPQPDPWKSLQSCVARVLSNSRGNPDLTYQRQSRRQAGMPEGIRLKGPEKRMPKAAVVVDTSGSMTAGCLAKALTVIKQGLKAIGEVPVITCDAAIGQDMVMRSVHDDFVFVGGGGTDMRIPLAYAEEKYKPDVVVIVTDTYTPWPDKPMKARLIVAATQNGDVPEWAIKVRIPDSPEKKELD